MKYLLISLLFLGCLRGVAQDRILNKGDKDTVKVLIQIYEKSPKGIRVCPTYLIKGYEVMEWEADQFNEQFFWKTIEYLEMNKKKILIAYVLEAQEINWD